MNFETATQSILEGKICTGLLWDGGKEIPFSSVNFGPSMMLNPREQLIFM